MSNCIGAKLSRRSQDISGITFGRLTAIQFHHHYVSPSGWKHQVWECVCECGQVTFVNKDFLKNGHTTSCGCYKRQRIIESRTIHGHARKGKETAMWWAYNAAKRRCEDPNVRNWNRYGGRGIKFLFKSFTEFLEEMGPTWKAGLSLDRKNNNGNYELGNCKWSTAKEQARNRRDNRILEFDGKSLTAAEWGEVKGWPRWIIKNRLSRKWPVWRVLTQPVREW